VNTAAMFGFLGIFAVAIGGVLALAFKALSAEKRAGEQKARADSGDVNMTSLAAMLADMTNRHREEKERGDKLDDVVAKLLVEMASGPSVGAFDRLRTIIAAAKTADRDGQGVVSAPTSADARADTRLFRPGE
jgi:hypothetical protein